MIILLIELCTTEEGKSNISANVYKLQIKTTNKDLEFTVEQHLQQHHYIDEDGLKPSHINYMRKISHAIHNHLEDFPNIMIKTIPTDFPR